MSQAVLETVRLERLLPGPIERVWEYLTRPDLRRTWLAGSAAELAEVTRSQPHRRIEFAMRDSSVVSMELEPCGSEVKLVLTHRRVPAWLAGAATVIVVALFMLCGPSSGERGDARPTLGPETVRSAPSLKLPSFGAARVYGMLGGRC